MPQAPPLFTLTSRTGLSAVLSYASAEPGLLTLVEPATGATLASRLGASIRTTDDRLLTLGADFAPSDPPAAQPAAFADPILGPAERVVASYWSASPPIAATVDLRLARDREALIYQVRTLPGADNAGPRRFALFGGPDAAFNLPGPVEYFTLLSSRVVQGTVNREQSRAFIPLEPGGPVLLWSEAAGSGYVAGALDSTQGLASLELSRRGSRRVGVELRSAPQETQPNASPRIYLERVHSRDLTQAFAGYRAVLDAIAPAPPLPTGSRHQWGSWYVFAGGINEQRLREQIDTLASVYGDVGPWQLVVDAGWYLAGPHPDGEIGVVDRDKFPSGMRALVDYAHERGVRVILYGSAPWVDSRPSNPSWWVVQLGFVRDHRDWLILVDEDEEGATYVYDLSNPDLRAYLRDKVELYLREFDADGIQLDMVGVIGPKGGPFRGEPISPTEAARQASLAQTMTIYRLLWNASQRIKPGAWIESGFATPPLARGYGHVWRLADDYPAFSSPYPFAGLLEQVTSASLQQQLWGRRPHLGYIHGDDTIQRQWLAAAVALQSLMALSVDMTAVPSGRARMYREYLAALRPFSATPSFGPGTPPESFSTLVDGTMYLGLLNNGAYPRDLSVDAGRHGLQGTELIAFDPETREAFLTGREVSVVVPAESLRLLVLRADPGVLWADRAWSTSQEAGELVVHVQAGPDGPGRLWLYTPGPHRVRVTGGSPGAYWLQRSNGLLTVNLPDGSPYEIRVSFEPRSP